MKEKKPIEFVGAIIGNIIGIALNNSVLLWYHRTGGIILDTWVDTLWASNLSLIIQILGNLLLVFYRPARMYSFIQLIFAAVNLLSIIVFFIVFPIDFSRIADWMNKAARIGIMIGMGVTMINGLVNFVRAVLGTEYNQVPLKKINQRGTWGNN